MLLEANEDEFTSLEELACTTEESVALVKTTEDESLEELAVTTDDSAMLVDVTNEELDPVAELEGSHSGQ